MFTKLRAALTKQTPSGGASIWLIVGLGNPGTQYRNNRHNVGFMAVDRIATDQDFAGWTNKFASLTTDGRINGQRVVLLKPQAYMNRSGLSVAEAARFYKITSERIIVIHDELDLPTGKVRVKSGGGSAGHNGLKSVDLDMGDPNYTRVRIGIDHPGNKNQVSDYVLSNFNDDEVHIIDLTLAAISREIEVLLSGKQDDFMTRIAAAQG